MHVNIKSNLYLTAFLICSVYILIGTFLSIFFYIYQQDLQKTTIAHNIMLRVFERRFLADEYLLFQSERSKSQWLAKQQEIKDQLTMQGSIFKGPQEKDIFHRIDNAVRVGDEAFAQLVQSDESKQVPTDMTINQEKRLRLASQLSMGAQEAVSAAAQLAVINQKNSEGNFQKIIFLLFFSLLLFFLILITGFKTVWESLRRLQR